MGCGSIDDNQPAQLISTVPAEGEYIDISGAIYLKFDKPVKDVLVDGFAARNGDDKSSAATWEIDVSILELWPPRLGLHPEKLVELDITFEDDAGRHREKVRVRRGAMPIDGEPLEIMGGTVANWAHDIDAELVSTIGIQLTFNENIKPGTVVLRPEDGAWLTWIVEWGRNSVTLYPPEGERLQNGTKYLLLIIDVKDEFDHKHNFTIRFATKE